MDLKDTAQPKVPPKSKALGPSHMNLMAFVDGKKYQDSECKKATAPRVLSGVLLLEEKEMEMTLCCCRCKRSHRNNKKMISYRNVCSIHHVRQCKKINK